MKYKKITFSEIFKPTLSKVLLSLAIALVGVMSLTSWLSIVACDSPPQTCPSKITENVFGAIGLLAWPMWLTPGVGHLPFLIGLVVAFLPTLIWTYLLASGIIYIVSRYRK